MLLHPKCVAVGEVGLDFWGHPSQEERDRQGAYLDQMATWARSHSKPIVIHCRPERNHPQEAREECIRILQRRLPKGHKIYVHCFHEDVGAMQQWIRAFPQVRFGLGRGILDSGRELLQAIELERILLESDAPYQLHHASQLRDVAQRVAEVKNLTRSMIWDQARRNAMAFFSI